MIDYHEKAQKVQGAKMVYLALTAGSARDILWDEFLEFDYKYKIGLRPNVQMGIFRWPNGSRVKFAGADASEREMKKILGQKLYDVKIDECGSFTIDMKKLCYQMIRPALIDLQGYLTLMGTCETIPKTFFEQVCEGIEPGWSVHKWSALDNPYVSKNFEAEIDQILKENPNAAEAAWFITHFLNRWCTDENLLIIPISKLKTINLEPDRQFIDRYILGVDLGFNDATSFSLGGYNNNEKIYYQISCDKDTQLDFTDTALAIANWQRRYPISKIIIDGANKQGVEELRRRHGLPLHSAEKSAKADWLRLLRDDVVTGKFAMVEAQNNLLFTEWEQLLWKDEYKQHEDPRCQNHLSDATLYAWREAYHYLSAPEEKPIDVNSEDYMDQLFQNEIEQMHEQDNDMEYL